MDMRTRRLWIKNYSKKMIKMIDDEAVLMSILVAELRR